MYNTDKLSMLIAEPLTGKVYIDTDEGKEWANGYELIDQSEEAKRRRKHFDIRDLFIKNHYKERRAARRTLATWDREPWRDEWKAELEASNL